MLTQNKFFPQRLGYERYLFTQIKAICYRLKCCTQAGFLKITLSGSSPQEKDCGPYLQIFTNA